MGARGNSPAKLPHPAALAVALAHIPRKLLVYPQKALPVAWPLQDDDVLPFPGDRLPVGELQIPGKDLLLDQVADRHHPAPRPVTPEDLQKRFGGQLPFTEDLRVDIGGKLEVVPEMPAC